MGIKIESRFESWKEEIFANKYKILFSIVFVFIAVYISYYAGIYVDNVKAVAVPDAILDLFKPVDVGFFFVWGIVIAIALFFFYPLIFKPGELHYYISMFSLLIIVRAFFTTLTHLGVPPDTILINPPAIIAGLYFSNDLFFSGHTAVPFLAFLIIKDKFMRYLMLALSIFLGAITLLAHRHYSIDVLAAFFIAYGVYKMGNWFFNKN